MGRGGSGLSQVGERHPHSYPLQLIDDKKLLGEKCEAMVAEIRRAEQRHREQATQVQEQHQLVRAAWGKGEGPSFFLQCGRPCRNFVMRWQI